MFKLKRIYIWICIGLLIFSNLTFAASAVKLFDTAGVPRGLNIDGDGNIGSITINDFFTDISKGLITGTNSVFKFGRSGAITTTESVIWDGGGTYVFLSSPEYLNIVSTSVEDDATTGSGAYTLIVYGLGADYISQYEIISLNGQIPVQTTKKYLRTFRALILTSGTAIPIGGSNLGDLTFTSNTTSTLQAKILINNGQTLMAIYTIPAGYTGYVTGLSLSTGQGKQVLFKGKFRNGVNNNYAFSDKFTMDLYQSHFFGDLKIPLQVPQKTDIVFTGTTTSGTVDCGASFGVMLIANE